MSRDVSGKMHGGCNFEKIEHKTVNFKKHLPAVT